MALEALAKETRSATLVGEGREWGIRIVPFVPGSFTSLRVAIRALWHCGLYYHLHRNPRVSLLDSNLAAEYQRCKDSCSHATPIAGEAQKQMPSMPASHIPDGVETGISPRRTKWAENNSIVSGSTRDWNQELRLWPGAGPPVTARRTIPYGVGQHRIAHDATPPSVPTWSRVWRAMLVRHPRSVHGCLGEACDEEGRGAEPRAGHQGRARAVRRFWRRQRPGGCCEVKIEFKARQEKGRAGSGHTPPMAVLGNQRASLPVKGPT